MLSCPLLGGALEGHAPPGIFYILKYLQGQFLHYELTVLVLNLLLKYWRNYSVPQSSVRVIVPSTICRVRY